MLIRPQEHDSGVSKYNGGMHMEENRETGKKKTMDISVLSHEITYRRYLLNKGKVKDLFENISIPEYIALHSIARESEESSIYGQKTYLKDISAKMELTMRQTSKMIGDMRDRGLLIWSHDGNGSEGTYVTITEAGEKLLEQQQVLFKDYYGRVIKKFGKENLIQLLNMMKQLETVMSSELEEMEEQEDDGEFE